MSYKELHSGFGVGMPKWVLFSYCLFLAVATIIPLAFLSQEVVELCNSLLNTVLRKSNWFSRAGALMTIIPAVVEFLIVKRLIENIKGNMPKDAPKDHLSSDERAALGILQVAGLVLICFGTFIWAYGDLFV